MAVKSDSVGCRNVAVTTVLLVGTALVFMVIGLTLVNDTDCSAACETLGLTLLWAGLPISGLLGVLFGDLVVAWPLDITFWVIISFVVTRISESRARTGAVGAVIAIVVALIYGLVLSTFVEIAIPVS